MELTCGTIFWKPGCHYCGIFWLVFTWRRKIQGWTVCALHKESAKAIGGLDPGQIPLAKLYILPFPDGLPCSDSFQGITECNV